MCGAAGIDIYCPVMASEKRQGPLFFLISNYTCFYTPAHPGLDRFWETIHVKMQSNVLLSIKTVKSKLLHSIIISKCML